MSILTKTTSVGIAKRVFDHVRKPQNKSRVRRALSSLRARRHPARASRLRARRR